MNFNILIFTCLLVLSASGQVTRNVMLEHFTSNGSLPSAAQNPPFYGGIVDPNAGDVIHISYHLQGDDIFGDSDPSGVSARQTLYGSTNIPFVSMNGRIPNNMNTSGGNWFTYAGAPSGFTQTAIDNELVTTSPFSVSVSHEYSTNFATLSMRCVIQNQTSLPISLANHSLFLSIVTESLNYPSAPNSNGETYFRNIHRAFIPDQNGTVLSGNLASGDSAVFTFQESVTQDWIDLTEVKVVGFVQNTNSNEIIQADESLPITSGSFVDLVLSDQTNYGPDLCTEVITPTIVIENTESGTVDSVTIRTSLNGQVIGTETVLAAINGAGQSTVNLSTVTLLRGSNELSYEIIDSQGDVESNYANNTLNISQVLYFQPSFNPFTASFESDQIGEFPADGVISTFNTPNNKTIAYVGDQSLSSTVTAPIGGYGQSENALVFDFFSGANGEIIEYYLEGVTAITPETSVSLRFDYAYATRMNEGDQFLVLGSPNCGSSWDTLFNEAGSILATTPDQASRFWPTSTDWDSLEFTMATYSLFKLVGISSRRSALYIDNVNLDVIGSTSEVDNTHQIKLYPNPSSGIVRFTGQQSYMNEPDYTVTVYSLTGQILINRSNFDMNQPLDVSSLSSGLYFIKLSTDASSSQVLSFQKL